MIVVGILLLELQAEGVDFGAGLRERDAGLEARDHVCSPKTTLMQETLRDAGENLVAHGDGNPHVGAAEISDAAKIARGHADDGVLHLVELNRFTDDVAVRAELRVPERVTENHVRTRSGVFVRRKEAPEERLHAENVEEIRIHQLAGDLRLFTGNS